MTVIHTHTNKWWSSDAYNKSKFENTTYIQNKIGQPYLPDSETYP